MKKTTLKLYEFYQLSTDLEGSINPADGSVLAKGLLSEKIKLSIKYWLTDLAKKVAAEKEAIEKLKEDLIKKHGEAGEDGSIGISMYTNIVKNDEGEVISREVNPTFVEFQNEFNSLLQEEREVEHKDFKLADFDNIETEQAYVTFFKLVDPE